MSMTDAELQTLENLGHGDAAEEIRELRNDLSDALDCKNGTGPTSLSLVIEERDSLRAELAASREREARMRALLQAADVLFAHHCQDCTAWNWLDDTRAALAEGAQG